MIGQTVSHFQITDEIGRGGMGEVYRAQDLRLGRSVALKFLNTDISNDPDLLRRFKREARILASLDHPGIGVIHDIDEADGRVFLVLEFVDGEPLASRLQQGRLSCRESLEVAVQVCAALEAAHGRGIVHRDLKPANLMLQAAGHVKVLDFGIARARREDLTSDEEFPAPGVDSLVTGSGVLLGTACYMSPEQSRGEDVDRRTDIWSLGCVIFECLSGIRPFAGATMGSTIHAIRSLEPPWDILPADTPQSVIRILRRCLRKQPGGRYHAIADVRLDLEEALAAGAEDDGTTVRRRPSRRWLMAAVPSVLVGLALGWILTRGDTAAPIPVLEMTQFTVAVNDSGAVAWQSGRPLAVSPDGRFLACAVASEDIAQIQVWDLARATVRRLPGTEGAHGLFFSPDRVWLGFFSHNQLKRIRLSDDALQTLCEVVNPMGASWCEDGSIVLTCGAEPMIHRVPETGGIPRPLVTETVSESPAWHVWPTTIRDSDLLLTTLTSRLAYEESAIAVVDPETGEARVVLENAAWPTATRDGNLLFVRDGLLQLVVFDSRRGVVAGQPVALTAVLDVESTLDGPMYAYATAGTIALLPAASKLPPWREERSLVAIDTTGVVSSLGVPAGPYTMPSLSPDEQKLALTVYREDNLENWIWDFRRQAFTKLPPLGNDHIPVWSPTGDRIAVSGTVAGTPNVFVMPPHPGGQHRRLTTSPFHQDPACWSPDGRYLTIVNIKGNDDYDILLLDLAADDEPRPLVVTPFRETCPMIAPDGRWLVFESRQSGRPEIYLQAFPEPGPVYQVSTAGGMAPLWSRDGRRVYFWTTISAESRGRDFSGLEEAGNLRQGLAVVDFLLREGEPVLSPPRQLLTSRWIPHSSGRPNYDITSDDRILLLQREQRPVVEIRVVTNWQERLEPL